MTLALCVLCTGTSFNWRHVFNWLGQNSENRLVPQWQNIHWKVWINH